MSLFSIIGLYFRTVRHVKTAQLVNRVRRLMFKSKLKPIAEFEIAAPKNKAISSRFPQKKKSLLGDDSFVFLNRKLRLDFPEGWSRTDVPLLWLYNLHYFDGLLNSSTPDGLKVDLVSRWIKDNSQKNGVPWHPYPLSIRICNWIKWIWSFDGRLPPQIDASLFQQTTHLGKTLEFHLLGNHLLENAKALIFAGYYFGGNIGEKWMTLGVKILRRELEEQVLKDGGHFELSPMYHSLVLDLILDVLQLAKDASAPKILTQEIPLYLDKASVMSKWLMVMSHPDQEIAYFNDAATGIAPSPKELILRAKSLNAISQISPKRAINYLESSGYIRLENDDATVIFDVAEVGAGYIPGHGHADTLSLECSLFGQRLIINTGTSEYGEGCRRDYERSTAAHSTLELDSRNSSEVWGGFRVGRRARISDFAIRDSSTVSAEHDGYRFLPGSPRHRRSCTLMQNKMVIEDCIDGPFNCAKVYFHIHPSIKVLLSDTDRNGVFIFPNGSKVLWESNSAELYLQSNLYAVEFGMQLPIKTLVLETKTDEATEFSITWD